MCCVGGMSFLPRGEKYAGFSVNVNFFDPKVKEKSFYDLTLGSHIPSGSLTTISFFLQTQTLLRTKCDYHNSSN